MFVTNITSKLLQNKKAKINKKKQDDIITYITTKKIKVGPWDEEEDKILLNWVKENGPVHWGKCAKLIKQRTGEQCIKHWKNNLNPELKKGQWTSEEVLLILKLYQKFGSWKKIICVFPGRAENSIKNKFYIQLRKIWNKKPLKGIKDHVSKIKLETLKLHLDGAIKDAENTYYKENKNVTKKKFEKYLNEIENLIQNNKKGNLIDLIELKDKIFNINDNKYSDPDTISMNEDEDEEEIKNDINQKIYKKKNINENSEIKSSKTKIIDIFSKSKNTFSLYGMSSYSISNSEINNYYKNERINNGDVSDMNLNYKLNSINQNIQNKYSNSIISDNLTKNNIYHNNNVQRKQNFNNKQSIRKNHGSYENLSSSKKSSLNIENNKNNLVKLTKHFTKKIY